MERDQRLVLSTEPGEVLAFSRGEGLGITHQEPLDLGEGVAMEGRTGRHSGPGWGGKVFCSRGCWRRSSWQEALAQGTEKLINTLDGPSIALRHQLLPEQGTVVAALLPPFPYIGGKAIKGVGTLAVPRIGAEGAQPMAHGTCVHV